MIWPFFLTPIGKILGTVGIVAVAWFAFARHYETKGAAKAVAKIERATDDAVYKARRAGTKSAGGSGVRLPYYRD